MSERNISHVTLFEQSNINAELRDVTRALITKAGGFPGLARRIGIKWQTLWNQFNRAKTVPAYVIPAIVKITGDPEPLNLLCNEAGYTAKPLPPADEDKKFLPIPKILNDLIIEEGDFNKTTILALEDGVITKAEYRRISRHRNALFRECMAIDDRIREKAGL